MLSPAALPQTSTKSFFEVTIDKSQGYISVSVGSYTFAQTPFFTYSVTFENLKLLPF